MKDDWLGVIAKQSLKDVSVLDLLDVLRERQRELGVSGMWTIMDVSINYDVMDKVVKKLKKGLRKGWYSYFWRGNRLIIVFKDKSFNIKKGSKKSLNRVKNWAFKNHNILPEVFSLDY